MKNKLSRDMVGGLTSFAIEALLVIALGIFAALVSWMAIGLVG